MQLQVVARFTVYRVAGGKSINKGECYTDHWGIELMIAGCVVCSLDFRQQDRDAEQFMQSKLRHYWHQKVMPVLNARVQDLKNFRMDSRSPTAGAVLTMSAAMHQG